MEAKNKWYYDHLKELHNKKLELIKSKSSRRIDNSPPTTLKLAKNIFKSQAFVKIAEHDDIYRKNQAILNTINTISNRKVISI